MARTTNPLPKNHEGLEEKKSSFSYEVGSLGDLGPNTKRIHDDTLTSVKIEATWVGFHQTSTPSGRVGQPLHAHRPFMRLKYFWKTILVQIYSAFSRRP